MFKYDGYIIKTIPDYANAIEKGDFFEELRCEVYLESDTNMERCLNEFNMMPGFEFKERTVIEIENAIMNIMNDDRSYLQLKVKQGAYERRSELFYRAVEFIKESVGEDDIETTLKLCLGMTDEEIKESLDGLNEPEESKEIKMM